ncbi:MAG: BatD family protein, partial [Luteolibacter sp.]
MKHSSKPAILVLAILLSFASYSRLCAEASANLSSRFLARGEQAVLELAVTKRPGQIPQLPTIEGVTALAPNPGWQTRLMPGRRLEYVYTYVISSYQIGSHTIPSLEISAGNEIHRTQPVEFSIFNPDDLRWSEAISGRTRFRYASAFRVLNDHPYVGECTPIEIKIYVPRDLFVEDWGVPDFERDGLTAWRFQPQPIRGQLNLLGMPYISASYPSTITPVREGTIAIGPAKLRLMTMEVVMDGILRRVTNEVFLNIPALELDAQALPDGAPDGFDNAVGQFSLEVSSEMTDLIEGDPVPLEIRIQGSGNLDTLRPPKPVDSSGWKLYDATAQTRGDERRELTGSVTFQQFMRPLELKSAIPSFRLVYFDPLARAYQTVTSEPIPLTITPAPVQAVDGIAPPAAADTPVERMTDILGLIEMKSAIQESRLKFPAWAWHALGGLAAFGLILRALLLRRPDWFRASPEKIARRNILKEIKQLDRQESDQAFLLGCGTIIEKRFGLHPPEELQAVLNERDSHCFKGNDKPQSCLTREQRSSISNTLKAHLCIGLGIAFTLLLGIPSARADDPLPPLDAGREAYDSARYDEAIQHWLSAGDYSNLSADLLYNIGNSCYLAGAIGHAALY